MMLSSPRGAEEEGRGGAGDSEAAAQRGHALQGGVLKGWTYSSRRVNIVQV